MNTGSFCVRCFPLCLFSLLSFPATLLFLRKGKKEPDALELDRLHQRQLELKSQLWQRASSGEAFVGSLLFLS